jgi:hypothetical protein
MSSSDELVEALRDRTSLVRWLEGRGYVPRSPAPPIPSKRSLASAAHFSAISNPRAPHLLVLYDESWTINQLVGSEIRLRQRDAHEYRTTLRASGLENDSPALALIACPAFLCAFPLDGDPFGRRVRFTPERLATPGTPAQQAFARFRASTFEKWAREDRNSGSLADELFGATVAGRLSWTFEELFAGGKPDASFSAFLHVQRARLLELLIDKKLREALLEPIWRKLQDTYAESKSDKLPSLAKIARDRKLRSALVATVDTVLLRLVLYRYLEAQFGHQMDADEQREISFGSYDDIVRKTVVVDREKLTALRAGKLPKPKQMALELFAKVQEAKVFTKELRARADWYQREAGGDLHHGVVADAADVLQAWLLDEGRDLFAELVAGTGNDEYSFHYADLDPRAFQEFYETTIGTDLHLDYDIESKKAVVVARDFERNRKERGAFYTGERLCRWLVDRTIGRFYRVWEERFIEIIGSNGRTARLPQVKKHLDSLLGLRVVDPTCGGGIFLRVAFELLAQQRERIVGHVLRLRDDEREALARDERYRVITERGEAGEWEWHILLNTLYGVDVDVKALNIASNLLTLSALTYKRHGVCFPSFLHTSLKPGNALVTPLRASEREVFGKTYGAQLASLIDLRRRLRDPALPRKVWVETHRVARALTEEICTKEVIREFSELFEEGEGLKRIQRVGYFLYEAEFPEVFFERKGKDTVRVRDDAGFDIVIGNPPWEEPAAELKQFLPEFDATYRDLKGTESLAREKKLLEDPEIAQRFEDFKVAVDDYKKLLTSGWYEHQVRAVRGRKPGAHTNLYKYATEMFWRLLREGGRAGVVVDSGLWHDLAASGLRVLLFDQSHEVSVCGFSNNRGLFEDVHRSYKFCTTAFTKGGRLETLRAIFMQFDFGALDQFDSLAIDIAADEIRADRRDSYPVPEVRSRQHYEAERAMSAHPALEDAPWNVDTYSRELNAGEQRSYFLDKAAGRYPLFKGENFGLFGVEQGELPSNWVDPSERGAGGFLRRKQIARVIEEVANYLVGAGSIGQANKNKAAEEWIRARSKGRIPDAWIRLDWEGYRLAWRTEARNDDKRSLIATIIPPHVALTDKAPFIRPFRLVVRDDAVIVEDQYEPIQLLYLAGMLSSFAADSVARTRLAKKDFKTNIFIALPVPQWQDKKPHRRVAELCARLTCLPVTKDRPWADYEALASSVGLRPKRDGIVDPVERTEAEVELNARAAELYGLGKTLFRYLLDLLFMTPKHKAEHAVLRDAIASKME